MVVRGRLMIVLYMVCCYFWKHLLRADCSFNYFLPYSNDNYKLKSNISKISPLFVIRSLYYIDFAYKYFITDKIIFSM